VLDNVAEFANTWTSLVLTAIMLLELAFNRAAHSSDRKAYASGAVAGICSATFHATLWRGALALDHAAIVLVCLSICGAPLNCWQLGVLQMAVPIVHPALGVAAWVLAGALAARHSATELFPLICDPVGSWAGACATVGCGALAFGAGCIATEAVGQARGSCPSWPAHALWHISVAVALPLLLRAQRKALTSTKES